MVEKGSGFSGAELPLFEVARPGLLIKILAGGKQYLFVVSSPPDRRTRNVPVMVISKYIGGYFDTREFGQAVVVGAVDHGRVMLGVIKAGFELRVMCLSSRPVSINLDPVEYFEVEPPKSDARL